MTQQTAYPTWTELTTEHELTALLGDPSPRAANKDRTRLHELDRQWLAVSPFCLIGTAGADGSCDVSPKGDPPGFAHVLDDTTLVIPERAGNRRADGYRNVLTNPHVGLLLMVPGRGDTLRINGWARLVTDAPFFDDLVVRGHRPVLALVVTVEQVFHHCAKAFMRAQLWDPQTWGGAELPSAAVLAKSLSAPQDSLEELERYCGPRTPSVSTRTPSPEQLADRRHWARMGHTERRA